MKIALWHRQTPPIVVYWSCDGGRETQAIRNSLAYRVHPACREERTRTKAWERLNRLEKDHPFEPLSQCLGTLKDHDRAAHLADDVHVKRAALDADLAFDAV